MRRLISVLVVLMVCVAAIGFFRGWFSLSRPNRIGDGNKVNIQLSVDPDKAKADAAAAEEKVRSLSDKNST